MAKEIERKFLVKEPVFKKLSLNGELYEQGYLSLDPERTVRVRTTPNGCFLTIKSKSSGATRTEYEYDIPRQEAQEMLQELCVATVSKIRYRLTVAGKIWEVDEFLGRNAGLLLAEIELSAEDERFDLPLWAGTEVTDDPRYFNASLAQFPFCEW